MKGKVITPSPEGDNQFPPRGAIGTIWSLTNGKMAFLPDDPKHLPPECPAEDFGFYEMEPSEIQVGVEE